MNCSCDEEERREEINSSNRVSRVKWRSKHSVKKENGVGIDKIKKLLTSINRKSSEVTHDATGLKVNDPRTKPVHMEVLTLEGRWGSRTPREVRQ